MNSSILNSSDYYFRHLGNFLENAVGDNSHWLLCWRATLHGWNVGQFHSRCDGKNDTVTIIRKGKFIFGGYTDIPSSFLLQCLHCRFWFWFWFWFCYNSFTILIYLHCLLEFNFFCKVETSLLVCHLVMMVKCFCVMNLVTLALPAWVLTSIGLVAFIFNSNWRQEKEFFFFREPCLTQGLGEFYPSPATFVKAAIHLWWQ